MVLEKRKFLFGIYVLILIGLLVFVIGGETVMQTPIKGGNYSTTMVVNCTTLVTSNVSYNVSIYFNSSGGAIENTAATFLDVIWNQSANSTSFNKTVSITGLSDGIRAYNFTCYADNVSDQEWGNSSSSMNVTIDNNAPRTNFTGTTGANASTFLVTGGNYSGPILNVNVSASDSANGTIGLGIDSIYVNIANSSLEYADAAISNFTKTKQANTTNPFFNTTVNVTNLPDGVYVVTIVANDTIITTDGSAGNTVNVTTNITIDRTAPSSVTLESSAATKTSLTLTISASDDTSGIDICTSDWSSGPAITGQGTNSQTLTHTGLSCGTSYAYTVTCNDQAGNGLVSDEYTFSTSSCGTGSGPSGGSSTSIWKSTVVISDEQFKTGYTKEISKDNRVKVVFTESGGATKTHYVGVMDVDSATATIEISSNPVVVKLDVGEEAKVDVDDDGFYDIYVKLNGITGGAADLTISYLNEETTNGAVFTTGEDLTTPEETTSIGEEESEGGAGGIPTWIWWVVGIIIVVVVAIVISQRKK